jgi:hypothetical protein
VKIHEASNSLPFPVPHVLDKLKTKYRRLIDRFYKEFVRTVKRMINREVAAGFDNGDIKVFDLR